MDETKTVVNRSTMTTALAYLFISADVRLETDNLTLDGEKYWIQNIETVTSTAMADAVSSVGLGQQYDTVRYCTGFGTVCIDIGGASGILTSLGF